MSDSDGGPDAAHRPSAGELRIRAATIGEPQRINGTIELCAYDAAWPELFRREAQRVNAVLGNQVLLLDHVGSTSVPGLPAKPIIDMLLVVADSSFEDAYVPPMEASGYVLRIREPDWYEHRLFKGPDTNINLHVFSSGCIEIDRMLGFRDHLRSSATDRALYAETKRQLASRQWNYVQEYADAKTEVVEAIIARVSNTAGS
jgi:GrpB-like predicted nucleotidyltransferase (UPF0157 family)